MVNPLHYPLLPPPPVSSLPPSLPSTLTPPTFGLVGFLIPVFQTFVFTLNFESDTIFFLLNIILICLKIIIAPHLLSIRSLTLFAGSVGSNLSCNWDQSLSVTLTWLLGKQQCELCQYTAKAIIV